MEVLLKDEREDVQKKTFAKWINSQLVKGQHAPVTDLFYDLRDGTRLLALLEVLTNKSYKREKGRMRVHHLNNVSRALNILEEHSVKLVNISNEHIVDGSAKITLGLVWAIILHWQVQGILKDVMSDLQQTNLEKTLLAWCRQATKGYPGVDVRNFTTSWTDGLAFNALIHNHSPQLFDWSVLARKHPYARLENAFRLANENFNIERLLDPEDVNSQVPDKKSIMMYVMCLFQAIPHGTFTMDSLDVSIQSDSSLTMEASSDVGAVNIKKSRPLSNVSIGLGGYQRTLEEVLTWLLGAEDRLAAMPPIAETTDNVKDQFHELEELMLELTSKQGGIGDVLGEGSRLMREGVMDEEEEEEVRVQMKLLNTRWEELRVKAMDRQSRLHEKLMSLQQKQLESLKRWLTETEDRIANMSQLGPTLEAVREQVKAHQLLQKDLENEQANINSLSNMVVVVDETNSDTVYSTLEDELNALGERWAHICKWAESRWSTLQTLSVHWEHFSGEMEKMRQWMDEKETLLRQMESNPSLEQEHMLQQASMLQVLQAEMDIQHKRLEHVQSESAKILSHLPQESSAQETVPSDMETLQDRLDCLVSIVEAQTQRLAASGIDITKVVAPTDGSSDVVSSSTTTISNEGGTVVTKIITTKVVTTEIVEGSVKRQKLEGGSQEDFTVALHQLGGWMDNIEAQLKPKAMEELSVEQLNQVVQQLESEMEKQKEEYYKVISLGESAISETSTIGESSQESEQQVAGVSSRWEALTEMLVQIRTRVTYLTEKKKISIELSDMDVAYQGFLRWCEDVRTVSENEPYAVALQMEQCQNKVAAMQDYEKQISALKASSESLDTRWSQETHILLEQIELFVVKWNALLQRLVEWNETLKEQIERTSSAPEVTVKSKQSPPESLLKAMEASRNWLESLEVALAAEYSVTTLPQMQEQHAKFKDLSQKVEMEQGNMAHINEACNVLLKEGHVDISEDISKLNNQWKTTTEALNSRITALEKVIEKQKQYNDEVSGLQSWLAEVDVFLKAEDAALGDVETLEAQLEQSNALQDDIVTLQTNVTNITLTGKQLMDDSNVELKAVIQTQLEDLTKRWEVVTHMAQAQNKSLKEALARSQKVHDDIEKLNSWLEVTEQKIPTNSVIETSEDLTTMIGTFDQLREDINNHSADFRALNDTGNEMLQQDSSATHDDLARQFTQLNGRWTEVVSQVDSKHKVLTTAVQHYEDFKKLCQEETEWLDQLEEKLKKSSKTAADAEEISEALDELEIFLHSHDESRLEKIRHLAEELVRENCMAVAVQTSTHTLTSRFNSLNVKASEQKSGLEGGVQEAQAWEREYVSVLDYLAQSDLLLSQAIADPQLEVAHDQVQSELLMQQDILKKMQTQVEVYREQGKTEAAMRLEDQVTHLKKKCEEIEVKLHLCQKPSDFDDRLNQMQVQLEDISQNVLVVQRTSGAPEGIQDQLDQCMALYQRLSEVKGEVESVIATGRKIVKEGQSAEPDKLTLQLDQLKALYNQLGGAVTEQRSVLERAHRQCRKIYKDTSQLEEWLTTTECELDQREATIPTKHVQGELDFAQHAIDDLGRKKPLLTGVHESYGVLASMCDDQALLQPVKEHVDDIALTWERVTTRLANRFKNMQSEQIAKEAEMENFIVGLGEIKGWLQSTEVQLARINSLEPQEQARMIQAISSEVQDYRGQIENIRDTAVDLINHGALFQARIQPELVNINQRWENIYKAVQVNSDELEDTLSNLSQNEEDELSSTEVEPELSEKEGSIADSFQDDFKHDVENLTASQGQDSSQSQFEATALDIGIKKRKRYAKIYDDEADRNLLKELTSSGKQKQITTSSEGRYDRVEDEAVSPPCGIENVLKIKELHGRLDEDRWESCSNSSSSSSSSKPKSKRRSSSEGSIDFGSETRGAISGDWDDAYVNTEPNMQLSVEAVEPSSSASIETAGKDELLRFSFVSSSSIEVDKVDEAFSIDTEVETLEACDFKAAEVDSPSSDESDDLEEPSKVRISAATIYEDAVIQALEGFSGKTGERKGRQKIPEEKQKETTDNSIKVQISQGICELPTEQHPSSTEADSMESSDQSQKILTKSTLSDGGHEKDFSCDELKKISQELDIKPASSVQVTDSVAVAASSCGELEFKRKGTEICKSSVEENFESSKDVEKSENKVTDARASHEETEILVRDSNVDGRSTLMECVVSKSEVDGEFDAINVSKVVREREEVPITLLAAQRSAVIETVLDDKTPTIVSVKADPNSDRPKSPSNPEAPAMNLIPQYTSSVREEIEAYETVVENTTTPCATINVLPVEVSEETSETGSVVSVSTSTSEMFSVVSVDNNSLSGMEFSSFSDGNDALLLSQQRDVMLKSDSDSTMVVEKADDENMEKFSEIIPDEIAPSIAVQENKDEVSSSEKTDLTEDSKEKVNVLKSEGVGKVLAENEECSVAKFRRISASSSSSGETSSSGSTFEMIDHEPELDLEEQLSSHESTESEEKRNILESESGSDEEKDKIVEPGILDVEIRKVSQEVKLERHISIDSSVSTLSEAETVIHVPIGSLLKRTSETTSVKDDSQIGVRGGKAGESSDSLVRSVSEELIIKTDEVETEVKKVVREKEESHSMGTAEQIREMPMKESSGGSSETKIVIQTSESGIGETTDSGAPVNVVGGTDDKERVCPSIHSVDLSEDSYNTMKTGDQEILLESIKSVSSIVIVAKEEDEPEMICHDSDTTDFGNSNIPTSVDPDSRMIFSENITTELPKKMHQKAQDDSEQEVQKCDVMLVEHQQQNRPSGNEMSPLNEEEWTEIKMIKQEIEEKPTTERRVSIDVAQVIQRTEKTEEQEVTISVPDTHLGDYKDEYSGSCDVQVICSDIHVSHVGYAEAELKPVGKDDVIQSEDDVDLPSFHIVEKVDDMQSDHDLGGGNSNQAQNQDDASSSEICEAHDDGACVVIETKDDTSDIGDKVSSFTHCELKDVAYVVVDDSSPLNLQQPKKEQNKEHSSSSDTSNSNSSSPYYDASGEMVESLGSDEISSSMEVLHSSAEILDIQSTSWSSTFDSTAQIKETVVNKELGDKHAQPGDTKKGINPWIERQSARFSTISVGTDASGDLIFSETEGEEYPCEDTTDDDLSLEEEALKTRAQKQQDAVQAGRSSFETSVTTKRHITESSQLQVKTSVYSSSASEMTQLDDDEVDAYLREVTAMSDKITDLKTKLLTVPSYQEAQEMSDALEQEVASLEPDVATVISRGDTLTLTTHMVNVPRANNIRTAVKDLRSQWSALKTDTENRKVETEQVARDISNISTKGDEIINWANDASKKLHLVNNDESQLEALEQEMANKKKELDKLNESRALLRKYRYTRAEPMLNLVNSRWTDVTTQFRQYRKVSLEKKTIVDPSKVEIEPDTAIVPDFVASVNRLREAISAISRQVNANKLAGNHYDNLKTQEEELKVIKEGLETLKPRVDGLETERNVAVKNATPTRTEQVRRVMDKLREEWAQVNRGHTERHTRWLQCSETWRTLQKTIDDFGVWLNTIEERVNVTASQPLPEAKITQKELEKQVTLKHRPSQTLQSSCKEVVEGMNHDDGKRLQEHVDTLMKRWRALLLDLAARRERIASEEGGKEGTSSDYEVLVTWVDQAQALMEAPVNVTDEASLSAHSTMVQNHVLEMNVKQNSLKRLKDSKPKGISPQQMTSLETNMNKVVKTLPEYKNMVETKLGVIKTLVKDVEDLYKWTEEMRVKVALRNLTDEDLKCAKLTLREKETLYENLDSTYWVLAQDTESKGLTVAVTLKNRMNTIESRLKALQGQLYDTATLTSASPTSSSATSPTFSSKGTEKVDLEKVVLGTPPKEGGSKVEDRKVEKVESTLTMAAAGSTVTPSVTTVIQNVMKFEESVLSTESELRPPSPLVSPPKYGPDSSPVLILASLDKSILQIRDWLTLMEQMTRQQTVEVGDADSIRQLTEKQKSVLRELEGKKPQLDELVASADSLKDDASRTQLHQKVSKLREHWDETNSVVLARKTQLDAMLVDTHKFDSKRSELETWLARMEARLERMAPVAHTADVLDQQIREQKGFHAEIHQYKHQVELFNQMTQRLIAIYQHDDTRRLKKITESINMRYSTLNSSIISRGKALHSAMNSLHNFDKSLDKFASWLSEVESSTDMLEAETDKLGPTRRDPQARATAIRLKDLQSEIESHKDVLASLNATGQKLLGTLENQDEAVMLQRRLEEMNQRWNTLKHKSIAIRNRLEGNAENWNSLLLSLRELIEWVIRKDTELTALGPLVGDLGSLSKFGEDLSSFRRVIDEKQPVIESNLKSGRQLIASEPPLSDTSDSEAGRELDGDARYRGDDNARDLTRSVRREVAKLSEKWAALRERAGAAAAQADLAYKKLGVLQKTVEDVSGRLEEAEKTVEGWGPLSQDPNLADQHAHNVRKFREGLAELQRGVDDVNDQAARFSAHNVPLTPANSAKLHDLNNRWKSLETTVNDRWRQVAGRSREVTPLTPAQLASSVSPPWERATTSNKVPYYINHDQENTHWDHPVMMDLLDSLTEFNHIKFSAYRTAMKLRMLQKKLALDCAKMQMATDIFDEHGLRGQNDRLIDVGDMVVVLSALYANISADHPEVDTTLAMDLCLNWLLNVYDSQRTGQMRVLSFKIGLVCLCSGHLEEKYRYMFRLIADPNRLVDQRKLGLLLHDCVQVPRQLGEVAAFGGSNIEPSVRSCFTKAGKDRDTIEALHFLAWVQQEPQSLVWLAVLHRVAASETIQHQVKCNICKAYPILGLRYRCLKCLSFDMCQRCFFDGRSGKSHKITHPMHEYCTATTAGEDVKDFTKALKNKFKSKRSLQKHTKKGYLPVQSVLEGDPLESPSPSPQHNVTSQDMHSRLELYASRLAEVELRTNSNSTPDSEDEHGLIAQYCQSLSSSDAPLPVPRSPLQIMAAVDAEQKDELEQMIRALEEENSVLQAEYDRLKSQQPVGSPPDDGLSGQRSEADMLAEAKLLRQHKGRLEARMGILEEHNRQLEAQLHRLRQLLGEPGGVSSPNKSGTLQTKSVTASQLAMDSPAKVNGHSTQGASSTYEGLEQMSEYVRPPPPPMGNVAHVGNLFSRAAPYRSSGWRPGEGSWHSGGHNDPRGGERLA